MNSTSANAMLAVDVGNTAIKLGRFDDWSRPCPKPAEVFRTESKSPDFERLRRWMPPDCASCYLISVYRQAASELCDWFRKQYPEQSLIELTHRDFPFPIEVEHPDRVGPDRLAGAMAASHLTSPGTGAIVVDAGSAITVDLVSADGAFLGGAIPAGQQASALALSAGTDLLPVLSTARLDEPPAVLGRATEGAIRSGIFWGTVGGIREVVKRLQQHATESAEVLLTGGDMGRLAPHIAPQARYLPNLVLSGIALAARTRPSSA